jgi:uncharacterized membrane protein
MNSRISALLGLLFVLVGSGLFSFYLLNVETNVSLFFLIIGTFFMAFSGVFSYIGIRKDPRKNLPFFLLTITLLYFFISVIPSIRFEAFSGLGSPDNLDEYYVAQMTLLKKSWGGSYGVSLEGRASWYFSCLSITIFPTILSEITGLGLSTIFSIVYPIIFSLTPALVFLLVREVYADIELAALSTILFSEFFRFSAPQMIRQYIALMFLILTLFIVFKRKPVLKSNQSFLVLFLLFTIGVAVSHYTVSYFMLAIFISALLAYNFSNAKKSSSISQFLTNTDILYIITINISWMIFFNTKFFNANIEALTESVFGIMGPRSVPEVLVPGRIAGDLVTGWYLLQTLLIFVGISLIFMKTRKKHSKIFAWATSAGVMLIILLILLFTPFFDRNLGFNRVYSIALPLFVPLLAYVILTIDKKLKHAGIFVILFLAINLPLNLYIPSYQNQILYSPAQNISPEIAISQVFNRNSELATFEWAQQYVQQNQSICVDLRGSRNMYSTYKLIPKVVSLPKITYDSNFLALNYYNVKHNLWWAREGISEVKELPEIISNMNILYDNSECIILGK